MQLEAELRNILGEYVAGLENLVLRRMRLKKVGPSVEVRAVQQARVGNTQLITNFFAGLSEEGGDSSSARPVDQKESQ